MKKVLIVEDNKILNAILRDRLEKEGFAVDIIESGLALLSYIRRGEEPDAVILDLFLPEKSGIELLDTIGNSWGRAAVFVYSAQAQLKGTCLRHPAVSNFFSKNEDVTFLIEAIKEKVGEEE